VAGRSAPAHPREPVADDAAGFRLSASSWIILEMVPAMGGIWGNAEAGTGPIERSA
jgi:hypothetical protein